MKRRQAFTVLEILLAAGLFLLLSVLLVDVFRRSARAALQGSTRASLVQQTNAACHRFAREVERSIYESASCGGSTFSCLSALDTNGVFVYDEATRAPRWQYYLVFYLDSANHQFRLRKIPVSGTPTENAPAPLETFPPAQPLSTYASGGQAIAQEIYACEFSLTPGRLATMIVGAQGQRRDRAQPEIYVQTTLVNLRN